MLPVTEDKDGTVMLVTLAMVMLLTLARFGRETVRFGPLADMEKRPVMLTIWVLKVLK